MSRYLRRMSCARAKEQMMRLFQQTFLGNKKGRGFKILTHDAQKVWPLLNAKSTKAKTHGSRNF